MSLKQNQIIELQLFEIKILSCLLYFMVFIIGFPNQVIIITILFNKLQVALKGLKQIII